MYRYPYAVGLTIVITAISLLLIPTAGVACITTPPAYLESYSEDPPPDDVPPPAKPNLVVDVINRGERGNSSCDDIGSIHLVVAEPQDHVAYEFELVDGASPGTKTLWSLPVFSRVASDGAHVITYTWIDGDTDKQEEFDFTADVVAVDKWGRRSDSSQRLHVRHPGRSDAVCSIVRAGSSSSFPLPVALLFAIALPLHFLFREST
jgi:hypothetical protein